MSSEDEIRSCYELDVAEKSGLVYKKRGWLPFLQGFEGMSVRKLSSNLDEVELFDIENVEEWDGASS